jgi:hypothetical protein
MCARVRARPACLPSGVVPDAWCSVSMRTQGGGATSSGPACGNGFEIILQAFNWESHKQDYYNLLRSQAAEIADVGITAIWMPPPSESVSPQA